MSSNSDISITLNNTWVIYYGQSRITKYKFKNFAI